MWISKSADERKKDFLDAAVVLFSEKGYDKTSLNDLIAAVGVTKGSFYHHFSSKEDIVDALIAELSQGVIERIQAAADPELGAVEQLLAVIAAVQGFRSDRKSAYTGLYPILSREENHALARRFQSSVSVVALPLLTRIIAQGNSEGAFDAPDAKRSAELILRLSAAMKEDLVDRWARNELTPDELGAQAAFYGQALERLLGAKPGSLPLSFSVCLF